MLSFRKNMVGRMWLLVRETIGESFRRQWSWPWYCPRCQCMELGHLCTRQCVSNYIRIIRNMSNNDSIVIVCRHKIKQRMSAMRLGQRDEPCCHKSTTLWLSQWYKTCLPDQCLPHVKQATTTTANNSCHAIDF